VVGRYQGGVVTAEELHREANRLPPLLRARFETDNGRREMVSALIDKRLLAAEAHKRGYDREPEVLRHVQDLQERLEIQSLLAAEEKTAGSPTDAELRGWYAAHRDELAQPERVRVRRILAAVPAGAPAAERERSRTRAEALLARVKRGEAFEKVAATADGAERAHGGDLGLMAKGDRKDPRLEAAAFALQAPGARSAVFECADGFAALELVERRAARVPPFEEVRGEVENRLAPERKRKAFEDLLTRLRKDAEVRLEIAAGPR